MELISPMFNKSVTLTAEQRNVSMITCLIWNFFASISLQFYNGAVLLGQVTVAASSTIQEISKSIDLTGVEVLTIKTNSACVMLGSLNIDRNTAFTFPGLSILNFRWLPEAVCPSITAASFDVPANITINGDGIKANIATEAKILAPFDNWIFKAMLKYFGENEVTFIEINTASYLQVTEDPAFNAIMGITSSTGNTLEDEIGEISHIPNIDLCSSSMASGGNSKSIINSNPNPSTHIKIIAGEDGTTIWKKFLFVGWNN